MPRKRQGEKKSSPEIRFSITRKLDEILQGIANELGVDKSDYIRSLILSDLKNKYGKFNKK